MGTLRERSPGTWELTVSAGRDPATGRYRRVTRTLHTTSKRQAKLALAELETSVASGRVSFEDRTVAALLDSWLDHLVELGRADTTLYTYRRYVNKELKPTLGQIRLSRLTALDIDRLYAKLRKRGLAPASIRQIHAILRAALHQAERWGLVDRNVARLASPPSQPQREQHPPDTDEVIALLDAASAQSPLFGLFIRVMVATGMRRAEVCGLRWSDIDFDTGRLNVSRSYLAIATARGDRPTKTRSARDISLDPVTLDQLEASWQDASTLAWQFRVSADDRRPGYIFTNDPLRRPALATRLGQRVVGEGPPLARSPVDVPNARPPPLPGNQAPRRRDPGAHRRRTPRPRRRHHNDEDLRAPHPTRRRARRRSRRPHPRRLITGIPADRARPTIVARRGSARLFGIRDRQFEDALGGPDRSVIGGHSRTLDHARRLAGTPRGPARRSAGRRSAPPPQRAGRRYRTKNSALFPRQGRPWTVVDPERRTVRMTPGPVDPARPDQTRPRRHPEMEGVRSVGGRRHARRSDAIAQVAAYAVGRCVRLTWSSGR